MDKSKGVPVISVKTSGSKERVSHSHWVSALVLPAFSVAVTAAEIVSTLLEKSQSLQKRKILKFMFICAYVE